MAPSLLLSLGHNRRLGGTILVWWGAQAVIWGGTAREYPLGVLPAASLQQFIEV